MPLAARQNATKARTVRPRSPPVVEHAGRAGRGEHEDVLHPLRGAPAQVRDARPWSSGRHVRDAHGANAGSRTVQKPGQLLVTTSGSSHRRCRATTAASTPNAIARRWSWWVASAAPWRSATPPAQRVDAQAVGLDGDAARPSPSQLGGEVAEAVALLGPDEPDAADGRRRRRRGGDRRPASARDRRCRPCRRRCRCSGTAGSRSTTSPPRPSVDGAAHASRAGRRTRRRPAAEAVQPGDLHPTADDGRHGQRVAGRRRVGLDVEVGAAVAPGGTTIVGPRRRRRRRPRTPPSRRPSARRTAATPAASTGAGAGHRRAAGRSASAR